MKVFKLCLATVVFLVTVGCGKESAAQAQTIAAWTPDEVNQATIGCINTAHASQPALVFSVVQTYCSCMVEGAEKLWTAADFKANAEADAKTLSDNGTTASCKTKAGL